MSKPDAERAMDIYRTFAKLTDFVVAYLSHARKHEHHTRVEVPKLKHAPVNLGRQLEEYLRDPDFEIHRRQYIAEQEAKKKGGVVSKPSLPSAKNDAAPTPAANNPFPTSGGASQSASKPVATKGPDQDLIDFFDSIEQNQTPMQVVPQQAAVNTMPFQQLPQQQPTGMLPQPTGFDMNSAFAQQQNPGAFMQPQVQQPQLQQPQLQQPQIQQPQIQQPQIQQQLQPSFTGAGFGGYTPQPSSFQPGALGSIPQDSMASFQPQNAMPMQQPLQTGQSGGLQAPQTMNPFRQSMLMAQQTGMQNTSPTLMAPAATGTANPNRLSTNPFARSLNQSPPAGFGASPFQPQQQPPAAAPLQPSPTGTNPFARSTGVSPTLEQQRPQTAGAALVPQPTGSTNPFRQGAFVNHNTGMGWQHNQAPIGGGIDQLPTVPVFPRPAQQTPWQQ